MKRRTKEIENADTFSTPGREKPRRDGVEGPYNARDLRLGLIVIWR